MSKETSQILLSKILPVVQRHKLNHGRDFLIDVTHAAQELWTEYTAILLEPVTDEVQHDAMASLLMHAENVITEKIKVLRAKKAEPKIEVVKPQIEVVRG